MVEADIMQVFIHREDKMNHRKKLIQILNSRTKKAKAKTSSKNKPKYVSKADRAKLEAEAGQAAETDSDNSTEATSE